MRIKSCRSKQRKNVYFAPAGQLHNIAIEHLPSSDSTFIAEQINFYRFGKSSVSCPLKPSDSAP
ncbi:hypothetical protein DWX15_18625, partial [Bacteroides sp. AF18-33]